MTSPCNTETDWECRLLGGCVYGPAVGKMSTNQLSLFYRAECGQFQNGSVTNYVQTVSFDPARRVAPCDVSELSQIMSEAKTEGIKVKAVGGCASLEAVATTHGVLIETYKLTSIEEEMRQINGKRAFWLGAGVTVSQAIEYLREQNMALADNGGWTGQTIVGAVMTGTHGSDLNFPPNSDFIRAIHFVMSDGRQYVFEPKGGRFQQGDFGNEVTLVQDDDEFYSSVVTVGSLGVVVRILFEPLPYYYVFQKVVKSTVPKLLAGELDEFRAEYENINIVINPFNSEVTASVRKRFAGSFDNSQSVLENARRVLGLSNLSLVDEVDLDVMKTRALASFGFRNVGELINEAIQLVAKKVIPRADAERLTGFFLNSLEQTSDGIFLPPIFSFSSGLISTSPVGSLGTEIIVPEVDLEEFVNQTVTSIHRGLQENPQPLILSLRFVGKSQHKLAASFDRQSVAMEILGLGSTATVARWAKEMKEAFPRSRMHWGLQQYGLVDAEYVQARYAEGFEQLQLMIEKYDPEGLMKTPYVQQVLSA